MYICALYPRRVKNAVLTWAFHSALILQIQKTTIIILTKTKFWNIAQAKAIRVIESTVKIKILPSSCKPRSNLMELSKTFSGNYSLLCAVLPLIGYNRQMQLNSFEVKRLCINLPNFLQQTILIVVQDLLNQVVQW